MTEGVGLSNQIVIRTLREKEIYKYLVILEVDIIKQAKMKEKKLKKSISESENYTWPNYIAGTLSKG